ncbi:glycosyltransferase family 2 protein [Bacillus sonorensis]|uniref:glycosyltransferase family 2 protein n=1 Tax=Bacillus sonorensis TaxID=119858 RepID=UPI0020179FC7|nr:glycosyltransferase [Bacillus sonorensis]
MSIVIPAYNDPRLDECLKSIDAEAEIIVALNGATKQVEDIAKKHNTKMVHLPVPNLAKAYNEGIKASSKNNVLLMDSDCIFRRGCIATLYKMLSEHPLAKGRVLFAYRSKREKIIATSRHIHTAKKNAYSPPLAFRKNIVDQIDGYYFDEQINWTEDYDFDARVRKANLSIGYDDSARVVHPALSLYGDLKSSYNYGKGQARGVQLGKEWYAPPERIFKNMIKSWTPLKNKFGTGVAAYLALWQISFFLGYKKESKATERGVKKNGSANTTV